MIVFSRKHRCQYEASKLPQASQCEIQRLGRTVILLGCFLPACENEGIGRWCGMLGWLTFTHKCQADADGSGVHAFQRKVEPLFGIWLLLALEDRSYIGGELGPKTKQGITSMTEVRAASPLLFLPTSESIHSRR